MCYKVLFSKLFHPFWLNIFIAMQEKMHFMLQTVCPFPLGSKRRRLCMQLAFTGKWLILGYKRKTVNMDASPVIERVCNCCLGGAFRGSLCGEVYFISQLRTYYQSWFHGCVPKQENPSPECRADLNRYSSLTGCISDSMHPGILIVFIVYRANQSVLKLNRNHLQLSTVHLECLLGVTANAVP